jgi:ABC-type polysaccharide/polyol phosphate export permease
MIAGQRLRELVDYRDLLTNLTIRDLKLKYKGSVLGVGWSLLNPLIMMAIYYVVFSLFLRVFVLPNYWAFVLGGLLVWIFTAQALTSSAIAFVRTSSLITKVYFPIETLPIANVLAHFVNFVIMLAILLPILLLAGVHLGPSLVLLPVILLAHLAFAIGLGLFLATLTVYFRDLEHVITLAINALFYLTPVLYPLDPAALPRAAARFIPYATANPLAWFLDSYHSVLYYGLWPDPGQFTAMLAAALVALVGGYAFFSWLRPRIPEEV